MPQTSRLIPILLLAWACGDAHAPDGPSDGFQWPVSEPAAEGMNADLLDDAHALVRSSLPNVSAFLVVRHGAIVAERYYHEHSADRIRAVRSVTKTFISAFVGIALGQGWIDSLDQTIGGFFPEYEDSGDSLMQQVTIRQLLTMTSGIDFERNGSVSQTNPNTVEGIFNGPFWTDPGGGFWYDGANPHLLSAIISRQAGKNIATLGETYLFGPLNIVRGAWTSDEQGVTDGGTGLSLTARDMAKLGQLYLQDGVWEGERILPEGWVEQSVAPSVILGPESWANYGFLWWVTDVLGAPAYIAAGFRQQFIIVLPTLDIVTVIQSELDLRGEERNHLILAANYVIPAVRAGAGTR